MSACGGAQTAEPNTAAVTEQKSGKSAKLEVVSVPEVAGDTNAPIKQAEAISPGPEMQRLVEQAKNDLATELSINSQDIDVLQAEFVTWPDSSVGCPQPGMQYLQVLTSGARILLEANNAIYAYHSGGNRPLVLCKKPSPISPLPYSQGEA